MQRRQRPPARQARQCDSRPQEGPSSGRRGMAGTQRPLPTSSAWPWGHRCTHVPSDTSSGGEHVVFVRGAAPASGGSVRAPASDAGRSDAPSLALIAAPCVRLRPRSARSAAESNANANASSRRTAAAPRLLSAIASLILAAATARAWPSAVIAAPPACAAPACAGATPSRRSSDRTSSLDALQRAAACCRGLPARACACVGMGVGVGGKWRTGVGSIGHS